MLRCPQTTCPNLFRDLSSLRKHLNGKNHYGLLDFPLSCNQTDDCKQELSTISIYMRHVRFKHDISDLDPPNAVNFADACTQTENMDDDVENAVDEATDSMEVDALTTPGCREPAVGQQPDF